MSIPLNIDWQQILLHLFNFAILAGGLYLLLYRPIKQFMEQRQAHFAQLHQEAQQDRQQAQQLKDTYHAQLDEAEAAIAQRRSEAERELEELRSQRTAEAKQEAEAILAKAREAARREREDILAKASKDLVDAAVAAAEKIAGNTEGDPYEQFLRLTGRSDAHDPS